MDTSKLDAAVDVIAHETGTEHVEKTKYIKCPCCGKMTLKPPLNVGEDLMDQYMACLVTGSPYRYAYQLYGGRMVITVEYPTNDNKTAVLDAVNTLSKLGEILGDSLLELDDIKTRICAYACIQDITIYGDSTMSYAPAKIVADAMDKLRTIKLDIAQGTPTDTQQLKTEIIGLANMLKSTDMMSAVPEDIVQSLFQLHNEVFNALMDAGFDENFWDRIKLG